MAIHNTLPIYKVTYDLAHLTTGLTSNFPRNFRAPLGTRMLDLCFKLVERIYYANCATGINKVPHLNDLLELLPVLEFQFRLSRDLHCISLKQYAAAIDLAGQIGKQANGWRKKYAASPAA
jgi:hypothetical protein